MIFSMTSTPVNELPCITCIICCYSKCQAYYNWAIAISDRAKMRGRTNEAEELWKQVQAFYFVILLLIYAFYVCDQSDS